MYDETHAMPRDENNPHGVGFEVFSTKVEQESAFNLDWESNRGASVAPPSATVADTFALQSSRW